jgi:hypothetical protein
MTRTTPTFLLALGLVALAFAAIPAASAAPGPILNCLWNPDFTGPLEATGLIAFHDGPVCTVTLLPCPDNPYRSCLPQ